MTRFARYLYDLILSVWFMLKCMINFATLCIYVILKILLFVGSFNHKILSWSFFEPSTQMYVIYDIILFYFMLHFIRVIIPEIYRARLYAQKLFSHLSTIILSVFASLWSLPASKQKTAHRRYGVSVVSCSQTRWNYRQYFKQPE